MVVRMVLVSVLCVDAHNGNLDTDLDQYNRLATPETELRLIQWMIYHHTTGQPTSNIIMKMYLSTVLQFYYQMLQNNLNMSRDGCGRIESCNTPV